MLSSRLKPSAGANMYTYMKSISEELRGLASELNIPIWSATQFNRTGAGSDDAGMGDISESFGVNFTADLIIALIVTEEMKKLNHIKCKQLKNRYDDMNKLPSWIIGVERSKMKLYDIKQPDAPPKPTANGVPNNIRLDDDEIFDPLTGEIIKRTM